MIIDASNGKIINSKEVYIHDDILEELCFNRAEKKLHLSILEKGECCFNCVGKEFNLSIIKDRKRFSIDFLNVIGFEMTSCDFWGISPHILDFEYVEKNDNTIIPKLFKIKDTNDYEYSTLKDREIYFETVITFTSGDKLRIACEKIVYSKNQI